MAEERKAFTSDCRTGEQIFTRDSATPIMEDKEVMEVKKFTHRDEKTMQPVIIEKPVYYRKIMGWVLKKNLRPTDMKKEEFEKEMGKKPRYRPVDRKVHIERLEEHFEVMGKRLPIYIE